MVKNLTMSEERSQAATSMTGSTKGRIRQTTIGESPFSFKNKIQPTENAPHMKTPDF
jgi:hypothetical protein